MDSMSDNAPERGRHDNLVAHLSPIQGNFIPVSGVEASRSQSHRRQASLGRVRLRSPQRRPVDQGVHLHLSLTDEQLEKLASTFVLQLANRNYPFD